MTKRRRNDDRHSGRRAGSGGLDPADEALWRSFAKNIDPLDMKGRVQDRDDDFAGLLAEGSTPPRSAHEKGGAAGKPPPRAKPARGKGNVPAGVGRSRENERYPGNLDARDVRRIGSGRIGIDARIDLHGLRQHEAHAALRTFLYRSTAKGHRMVLVITGKGGGRESEREFGRAFVHEGRGERGVLKRAVPLWLNEPELRGIVVSYTTAHIRHGGEGALYVQLRRRRS